MKFLSAFAKRLIYGHNRHLIHKTDEHPFYRVLFCFTLCNKIESMDHDKLIFITKTCLPLFNSLPAETVGKWGKLNAQQMVEHLTIVFDVSTGKIKFDLVTPVEQLPRFKEFLLSDKVFRENTKAPVSVFAEEPLPLQYASMDEALEKLSDSIASFENYFKDDDGRKTMHPVFGELNYEEWVLLHYKHVTHHMSQFGLM